MDAAPLSRSPSPDGPEERKLPPAGHRAPSEGKASFARGSGRWGGVGAPCGCRKRAGSPVLPEPRGLPQKQLCGERSDWKPKPKWSQIAPPPSSKHGKEQSQPVWNAAIKRITSEALLMKWMNLEHMKQGSQSERENLDSRRMVLTNLFTKQQRRCRHREETYRQGWGTRGRG